MSTSSSGSRPSLSKLRIAYFDDLTSLPVTFDIDRVIKGATARRATLDEVRQMVINNECEVALLPVGDALRASGTAVIPCSAVSVLGASRLFMIFSKTVPTEIRRVLVDKEDYSTASLAQLLFQRKLMVRPEFVRSNVPLDPTKYDITSKDGFDAYLLTGRHALQVRREAFTFSWDLTLAWYEYSHLPFVLHCWVTAKGTRLGKLDKELTEVARRNEAGGDISAKSAERYSLSQSGIRAVYEKALYTGFDPNVVTSLRKYAQEVVQGRILSLQPVTIYTEASSHAQRRPGA